MQHETMENYRAKAAHAAAEQRAIQAEVEWREKQQEHTRQSRKHSERAPQATASNGHAPAYPLTPLPEQHQQKPGNEAEITPSPDYRAALYRGSDKLAGKVALVTGGDSGIGRAVAVLFAREGADVGIVYLNEDCDAQDTCRAIRAEGRRALAISGDVRDPGFCEDAVHHLIDKFGRLDVLVNNAAFQEHVATLQDLSDAHLDMTVRTNFYGYVYMTRAALKFMRAGAAIVNTGSETALFGSGGLLDYAATKGAIHAFSKSLATNLVGRGIRVNVVAPGPVWTPLNVADRAPAEVAQFGGHTQMKRPAQPEEIAPAYVFLAAACCSSYITGIELPIMGGTPGG